ncbi:Subtilisin-like protease 4 [Linum grandiflorum]
MDLTTHIQHPLTIYQIQTLVNNNISRSISTAGQPSPITSNLHQLLIYRPHSKMVSSPSILIMPSIISSFLLLISFLFTIHVALTGANTALQTYIVHVSQPQGRVLVEAADKVDWYRSFLPTILSDEGEEDRLLYAYHEVVSGFSARLTPEEVKSMEDKNHFISARPEKSIKRHTTHSPKFLGLQQQQLGGFWSQDANFGKGVIIGVLDGGVLPSHPSFSGQGMSPPPTKWKGKCEFNSSSMCNNKLIGARSFNIAANARDKSISISVPPLDIDGHGTHVASTAAGAFVSNADVLGNARGTASGIAPYAHLAIYMVCFPHEDVDCAESDILAGLDAAIQDGVDVLSLSMGQDPGTEIFDDALAAGSFAAVEKGIFVSTSAGNAGPFNSTLSNEAPWLLTVGATTLDRKIVAAAKLGNGAAFDGESAFQPKDHSTSKQLLPLVFSGIVGRLSNSSFCGEGSLDGADVNGKVVVCERGGGVGRLAKGQVVKDAGGAAMILVNKESEGFSVMADLHVLPATHISFVDGEKIKAYLNSTASPTAMIVFKGTLLEGDSSAPAVVTFSSRGPTTQSKGILKPDIIGPGANIVAAWPFSLENSTVTAPTFNFMSGTSMSCPHLAGVAALLKSSHPSWSPAAIKSAIMTTADVLNMAGKPIVDEKYQPADFFATGSGHVNPTKANNPGLIYDINPEDYISYLCGLGYTDQQVEKIVRRGIKCGEKVKLPGGQLNYPSFSVTLGPSQTFSRTVTNVGAANSVYAAKINHPWGVMVTVRPSILRFSEVNQKATYAVTFTRTTNGTTTQRFGQGYITWTSNKYCVRSPISVTFQ